MKKKKTIFSTIVSMALVLLLVSVSTINVHAKDPDPEELPKLPAGYYYIQISDDKYEKRPASEFQWTLTFDENDNYYYHLLALGGDKNSPALDSDANQIEHNIGTAPNCNLCKCQHPNMGDKDRCDECGHTHTYEKDPTSVVVAPTCKQEGTCKKKCACGKVAPETDLAPLDKTDHTWEDGKCTVCEIACTHKYVSTDDTSIGKCDICHQTHKHVYSKKNLKSEATCISLDYYEGTCDICKTTEYFEDENSEFKPHAFSAWEVTQKATATTAGEMKRSCKNCGSEETKIIPAGSTEANEIKENTTEQVDTKTTEQVDEKTTEQTDDSTQKATKKKKSTKKKTTKKATKDNKKTTNTDTKKSTSSPKTGDTSQVGYYFILMLLSMIAFAFSTSKGNFSNNK